MKFLIIALSLFSSSVFAFETQRVSFHVDSNLDFGGRVYYACDSVETQTEAMLEKLGATGISVHCRGGLDRWGQFSTEAFVDATFDAPVTGILQVVQFRGFQGCHLAREIFAGVRDSFQITQVTGLGACLRSSDGYRFEVSVIK